MYTDTPASSEELGILCNNFVQSGRASAETLSALRTFVISEPRDVIEPAPTLGIDEVEERKALGRAIQAAVEARGKLEKVLRLVFWSLVMTAPLARLREFVSSMNNPFVEIDLIRTRAETMLKTCVFPPCSPLVCTRIFWRPVVCQDYHVHSYLTNVEQFLPRNTPRLTSHHIRHGIPMKQKGQAEPSPQSGQPRQRPGYVRLTMYYPTSSAARETGLVLSVEVARLLSATSCLSV
jgi:hypothetical protein